MLQETKITISWVHKTAQSKFYLIRVIPLCVGGFGEINEDFNKVLQRLAQEAASGHNGHTVSPLFNMDKKGGAYWIVLQQFKRLLLLLLQIDMVVIF